MRPVVFLDHRQSSRLNSGCATQLYAEDLFAIDAPFATKPDARTSTTRKRPASDQQPCETMPSPAEWPSDKEIAAALDAFVEANPSKFVSVDAATASHDSENSAAKRAAARVPSAYFFQGCVGGGGTGGGFGQIFLNETDTAREIAFQNRRFVLPPRSLGVLDTLSRTSTADRLIAAGRTLYGSERFDVVVVDPPWTNRSVKRQRSYLTAEADDSLSQLAIERLLEADGLLIVWYTHNAGHYGQLRRHLASRWNLRLAATWHWLKVTTDGVPICPLGRNFKKPYEHVLLATRNQSLIDRLCRSDGMVVVSVPSAVHSHKPNLDDVLEQFGVHCRQLRCLELFARSLKVSWVSFGNEVIKLQCVEMFDGE